MKTYKKIGALIILAITFVWVLITPELVPQVINMDIAAPHQGFLAPEFELGVMNGGEAALQDYSGKVVLLNFWASWCPPCRAEMPAIQQVYESYRSNGFEVVAINMTHQDSLPEVKAFTDTYQLTFPVLLDEAGETAFRYRVRALPTTFLIDKDGIIREVMIGGPLSETFLDAKISKLFEEAD